MAKGRQRSWSPEIDRWVWDVPRETRGSDDGWYLILIINSRPNLSFVAAAARHISHWRTLSNTGNNTAHLSLQVVWGIFIQCEEKRHTGEYHQGVREERTRWQCLITAATSSWLSSFFATSSMCCRVSGRGSRLLSSLTPAQGSLGEVKSGKVQPRSLPEELKWKLE